MYSNKLLINVKQNKLKMQYKKLVVSAAFLIGLGLTALQAQESINAAGGNATGTEGSVSYSVGQVVYTTNTASNGYSVSEGVQQPFEVMVVSGIEEANGINLSLTVYPNPTTDKLTLSISEFEISNLSYQLYSIQGKLLQNEKITEKQTSISMSDLMPANYFVKVLQGNKEVKIFKIIKTQ
jgi:hypothetical protein